MALHLFYLEQLNDRANFKINNGGRQEYNMSPFLFNLYTEVMKELWVGMEIEGVRLSEIERERESPSYCMLLIIGSM